MGKRGPPPDPTALKILRGNPGHYPLNKNEPKADGRPLCPSWLLPEAKRKWRSLVPQLRVLGVATKVDGDALAQYCQVWARWKDAEEFIAKHGPVISIRDEAGNIKYLAQVPQVSIAQHLLTIMRNLQREFGMTASARSQIHVEQAPKRQSEFMTLINRNKNA